MRRGSGPSHYLGLDTSLLTWLCCAPPLGTAALRRPLPPQSLGAGDGRVPYIGFEANKQGERVPTETPYVVDGDTLIWEAGGSRELTLTRKQ